jgi:hypothetical protein
MLKTTIINENNVEIRYLCDVCKVKNSQIFKTRTNEFLNYKIF